MYVKFRCYCQNNSFLVGIQTKVILRDNFENRKYQKMFRKYEILIGEKIKIVTKIFLSQLYFSEVITKKLK